MIDKIIDFSLRNRLLICLLVFFISVIGLVVLLIFLFLADIRTSLIASLTIPISIFISLIIMHLFGVGLTVMALGGLAIGIGKMANGSVIMVENIYRHIGGGKKTGKADILT